MEEGSAELVRDGVEISVKFRRERFEGEARAEGLGLESWWTDRAGDFTVALFQATREEQP